MIRTSSLLAALLACGASLAQAAAPTPMTPQNPGTPWVHSGEGAPARDASNMGDTDRKFIAAAAQSGLAEAALAQLAIQRAQHPAVRSYAQQLVADHRVAHAQLQQIVSSKGLTMPEQPSRDQQGDLRDLQKVAAKDFDKRFLDRMVRDHQKAVDLYGHEVKGRHQDGDLKNFAQERIVVLQRHYGEAQRLRKNMGVLPGK